MGTKVTCEGMSVFTLLGVAFVILKLCKVIEWSWWWVLLPFYLPLCIALLITIPILLWVWISSK